MARKAMIEKEKKRARLAQLKWKEREELKKVIRDLNATEEQRFEAMIALNRMPRNSSPIRRRNRCMLTGRCRGYLRKFQLSRLCFREMAHDGSIPGIVKASW